MIDPIARSNPFPYYSWLKADPSRRIYHAPHEKSFYVVHNYEDVKEVLTNHKAFSSNILSTSKSPFFALMDGENHRRIRDVVTKIFNLENENFPKNKIKQQIIKCTQQLIDKKKAELFTSWADFIPLSTLCAIYGVEFNNEKIQKFHKLSITINQALFVLGGTGPRRSKNPNFLEKIKITLSIIANTNRIWQLHKQLGKNGLKELKNMFLPKITTDEMPRPDFEKIPAAISALLVLMYEFSLLLNDKESKSHSIQILNNAVDNQDLTRTEAVMVCTFILFAGYETTASLLSNCVVHLAYHPKEYTLLKKEPELIDKFIEESLRYYTPVGRFLRKTTEEVIIGGKTISAGSIIIVLLGAANTDANKFKNPYDFQIERDRPQHLSFGKGLHFCIGAPLARYQVKTALKELIMNSDHLSISNIENLKMVTDRDNGILRYEQVWINLS